MVELQHGNKIGSQFFPLKAVVLQDRVCQGTIEMVRDASLTKTILFDLDDTLLVNPMSVFIPSYIDLFCDYVRDVVSPWQFRRSILQAVQAVTENNDPSLSNAKVFFTEFFSHVGVEREKLRPYLECFYLEAYPELARLTKPAEGSSRIVEAAFQSGLEVVIATNPLFPEIALEQRLSWANLPVTEFDYSLVTSLEKMHAAKPNQEYYREILDRLVRKPQRCIMVGDDWERDIVPAASLGIRVFWIGREKTLRSDSIPSRLWLGQGSLKDLEQLLFTD